jgi:hypothetical protein
MLNSKYLGIISYIQFFDFYNLYLVNISQLVRHFYAVLGQFRQKVRQILYAILMYSIRNSVLNIYKRDVWKKAFPYYDVLNVLKMISIDYIY